MPRVRFSPTGNVSTQLGNSNVSVNPITQSGGVSGHVGSYDIGSEDVSIDGSIGIGSGGASVNPRVTIGDSKGAQTGGQVGGTVGGAIGSSFGPVGSFLGSALGSTVGSGIGDIASGNQKAQRETKDRQGLIDKYREAGLLDDKDGVVNPDGSSFSFRHDVSGGLHNYQINVDNDIDYLAGMAGITASRLHSGRGDSKAVDQLGNGLGNAFLGKVGSGTELTPDSFKAVMTNARAYYANTGIKSKEDMLGLANQMYSQGRINDFDYATMKQTAGLVFDMDFNTAQKLMQGRKQGAATAGTTPRQGHTASQKKAYSPFITAEEARMSVAPLIERVRKAGPAGRNSGLRNAALTITQGLGAVSAISQTYAALNKASGGGLGDYIGQGLHGLGEALGILSPADPTAGLNLGSGTIVDDFSSYASTGGDLSSSDVGTLDFGVY